MTDLFYGLIAFLMMFETFKMGCSGVVYKEMEIFLCKRKAYRRNLKRCEISSLMKDYLLVGAFYYLYLIVGLFSSQSVLFAILLLIKCCVKEKSQKRLIISSLIGFLLLLFIFLNKYIFKISLGW